MKKSFRIKEDSRTSSPTLDNESGSNLPHKQMQGSVSTAEWTNEKHSMYLKSMEATFVDRLYASKEMSGQFKVLRSGSWQKISFVRENPQMRRLNECHDLKANPWIQHYQSSGKQGSLAAPIVEEIVSSPSQVVDLGQKKRFSSVSATVSGHLHLCESHMFPHDLVCNDTEMTDQNFTDEAVDGEKEYNRRKGKD
ncbi:cold-regulated protein 27 [Gastrolobium bilobum]|uniref:cold-regulated protein 27 n=1 Tax=Gastrolobium bilobum TaxID=150636 RepID=UPI002AB142E8|nr:cold-regulated protein 27 [Gastrolobium bilobum]